MRLESLRETALHVDADRATADSGGVDTPGNASSTDVLTLGGSVSGTVGIGDSDWYRVTLVAGAEYTFSTSVGTGDPFLELRDPFGVPVDEDDNGGGGTGARITHIAQFSGTYFIEVRRVPNTTPTSFSYQLSGAEITAAPPGDDIAANTGTTAALAVGGSISGGVGAVGDNDWYGITLQAGQSYRFDLLGQGGGGTLEDPYLSLYSASGALITYNDDGGEGEGSRAAQMRFTPTATGLYFVSAGGWDDTTGSYTLSAAAVAGQNPASAINWGTQLSSTNVGIYFAAQGQSFHGQTATRSWTPSERASAMQAAATWAAVTNLTFTEVGSSAGATFILVLNANLEAAGQMEVPPAAPAVGAFNTGSTFWNASTLVPGGAAFQVLIHELGHGLGLAHPHDDGGASEVMEGVTNDFESYGPWGLNQGVFTVMSYNDGWPGGPTGLLTSPNAGNASTPMAIDIAAVQAKYGATVANAGDTVYDLGSVIISGVRQFRTIWDTGGTDSIVWTDFGSVTIDLRAATLTSAFGGGGYHSGVQLNGAHGGFFIAAGVTIENASAGVGNDTLIGNDFANVLQGGDGDDIINGLGGLDTATYGAAAFAVQVNLNLGAVAQNTGGAGTDTLSGIENLTGSAFNDTLGGNGEANVLSGGVGSDILVGRGGDDTLIGGGGSATAPDYFYGGVGNDTYFVLPNTTGAQDLVDEGEGNPTAAGGAGDVDTIISQGALFWDFYSVAENLVIDRDAGGQMVGGKNVLNKVFTGDIGNDVFLTYGRSSRVDAGAGIDAISFGLFGLDESFDGVNTLVMKPGSGTDYLYEFESGVDKIDLTGFHYNPANVTGAFLQSVLIDVDNGDNDYCYLFLGGAGGVNNFIVFVGVTRAQIAAGDFIV